MARLLLVEDDHNCRVAMRILFDTRTAHELALAIHGQDALDWISVNGDPDVILLDLYMPVMDGFEFLQTYKGRAPIIIVSAWADANEDLRLLRVVGTIRKPVSSTELLGTIERVLRERRPTCAPV